MGTHSIVNPALNRVRSFLFFLLTACFAGALSAQSNDDLATPIEIVSELILAMQANDAARIRAVFSENASQAYGQGRPKAGESFRTWLQTDIIDVHGRVIDPVLRVDGNGVIVTGTYVNNNNYRNRADFLLVVESGKIISWTMRY